MEEEENCDNEEESKENMPTSSTEEPPSLEDLRIEGALDQPSATTEDKGRAGVGGEGGHYI